MDVVVGEIDLFENLHLLDDLCNCLDGDATAKSAVLKIQDRLLAFEFNNLCLKSVTYILLGGML
jgi:hypothetical protein